MIFLLGVLTYGCAQVLARRGGYRAWLMILAACAGSVFIRPNETLLVLGGFTIAMISTIERIANSSRLAARRP